MPVDLLLSDQKGNLIHSIPFARPSGVPRGPATSTGSLASQRHPGRGPRAPDLILLTISASAIVVNATQGLFDAYRSPSPTTGILMLGFLEMSLG